MIIWTPEQTEVVRAGFLEGLSHREIGRKIDRNWRVVSGKVKHLKEQGLLPITKGHSQAGSYRIPINKPQPRLFKEIVDDEFVDIFNLDPNICTILTSKLNQCKFPVPLEQAPSAGLRVCGKPVHTKGTPWRNEANESCQWCLEHIAIVYDPPHAWKKTQSKPTTTTTGK